MKTIRLFIFTILVLGLAGCPQVSDEIPEMNDGRFTVVMITDVGGLGDKGFNDAGWAGCEDAKRRLQEKGVLCETMVIESREQTDYRENLILAAERGDVVVALGFLMVDVVQEVARQFPDRPFILTDGRVDAPNVASVIFKEEEGGFLAGLLASFVTNTNVVGVMPGMEIPPVMAFTNGYKAGVLTGAKLQNKTVTTLSTTIGSFTDPVKAKTLAQQLLSQDADVLFQLSGISGLGVIKAVDEAGHRCFAIGVDIDQDDIAPGKVLTSVLKKNDRVVSDQIMAVHEGTFEGHVLEVGVKEDYLGLTAMKHTRSLVPPQALAALEGAKVLIAEEQIHLPRTDSELKTFVPPVLEPVTNE
jgi:basic membrane protein A and related proteins